MAHGIMSLSVPCLSCRPSFQESISAFKPVRPGFEPVDPCREGLRPTTRGYDHALGLPDAMPMINHVEMKVHISVIKIAIYTLQWPNQVIRG